MIRLFLYALLVISFAASLVAYAQRNRDIEGILLFEFEGQNFYEGATAKDLPILSENNDSWLNIDARSFAEGSYDKKIKCGTVRAYAIKFSGYKKYGPSGHLSSWWTSFTINKLKSMKQLSYPTCSFRS
jgi:hypothetical protein